VKISDNGCGIEDLEAAMKPSFTTGDTERSGMGFTVMQTFMDELNVKSHPGEGTVVTMKKSIGG
jgi:stage II sporulation protein AB (anti-sigma F factor)